MSVNRVLFIALICFCGLAVSAVADPATSPLLTSPDDTTAVTGETYTPATGEASDEQPAPFPAVESEENPEEQLKLDLGDARDDSPSGSSPGTVSVLLDLIWKLAFVLILAYLAIVLLKKNAHGQLQLGRQTRHIRVLESSSVGQGRQIHLIAVGKRCLLIGTSGQQMSVLGEITDEDEVADLLADNEEPVETTGSFSDVLSRTVPGFDTVRRWCRPASSSIQRDSVDSEETRQ